MSSKAQNVKDIWVFRPRALSLFRDASRQQLARDAMSGIIVGIVALPLAIAFAIASGVSPEVGIFTAIIGGFIVSALGGSSVQIGGPTGAFIIIVYGVIQKFGVNGLIVATLLAGGLLILMGALKLGTLIRFVPYPIVVGFTAGIAVTIFSTQMNDLFGLGLTNIPADFVPKWDLYLRSMGDAQWLPFLFGVVSILIIAFSTRLVKKIPGSLTAIVTLTAIAFLLKRFAHIDTLECIGDRYQINPSIPKPIVPQISFAMVQELFPSAFTIALLGAIESLLSASVADGVIGEKHDSNTELIAQGIANVVVPFFGGIPVTGAIARTMTNINNGGRTPLAGVIHAAVLLLLLLFFGPLLDYIPMAVLAGVLVVVSYNMSGWRSVVNIAKGPKGDLIIMCVTFLLTVVISLTVAIEIGLLISMVVFMKRMVESTRITVAKDVLAPDAENTPTHLRDERLQIPRGVEVYEIEGPYFFGIANRFEETMRNLGDNPEVRILRLRQVPFMDSTAVNNLRILQTGLKKHNITLVLSGVQPPVMNTLKSTGLLELIGSNNVKSNIHEALERAEELMHAKNTATPRIENSQTVASV